ncbi:hypothetical protein K0U07_02720 [bacterium]|nr:hypothetical protein [bacterium]
MKSLICFFTAFASLFSVDVIVCSYNRPMQLYAFLESMEEFVTGATSVSVLCRGDAEYLDGYDDVEKRFHGVKFYYQDSERSKAFRCFKPMVLNQVFGKAASESKYFMFAMDDIIITEPIDLEKDSMFLEQHERVHGFFYRLGKNVDHHALPKPGKNAIPPLTEAEEDIFTWNFFRGTCDWGYPNSLDFTIYRKADFHKAFHQRNYRNPNDLEMAWQRYLPKKRRYGACHGRSKMVNLMINRVNTICLNPILKEIPITELNDHFNRGEKIDIHSLDLTKLNSAHQDLEFRYISRD